MSIFPSAAATALVVRGAYVYVTGGPSRPNGRKIRTRRQRRVIPGHTRVRTTADVLGSSYPSAGKVQRLPPACTDTFAPPMQSELNWSSVDRRYLLSAALARNNSRRRFVLHRDLHIACLKQIPYCRKVIQRFT